MANVAFDFEWDSKKASANFRKHKVSFELAATVFLDHMAVSIFDEAHSQYEERWLTLGFSSNGVLLAVAHTYEFVSTNRIRIRIISVRLASKQERFFYADNPR